MDHFRVDFEDPLRDDFRDTFRVAFRDNFWDDFFVFPSQKYSNSCMIILLFKEDKSFHLSWPSC